MVRHQRKIKQKAKHPQATKMASEQQRIPTYPVWVGNLKDTVKEKDLMRVFSKHGQVASCKVMEDELGKSR